MQGIKLRILTPAYYRPTTWTRALWSSPPNPPAGKLWNDSLIKLSNPGSLRLSTMVTSDACVTGYSVCRARNLLAMHAHTPGEGTGFYQAEAVQNMFAVWQYMPVDVGEVITEVWQRKERLSGYTTLLVCRAPDYCTPHYYGQIRIRTTSNLGFSSQPTRAETPSWDYGLPRVEAAGLL